MSHCETMQSDQRKLVVRSSRARETFISQAGDSFKKLIKDVVKEAVVEAIQPLKERLDNMSGTLGRLDEERIR